jgi:hypothetical protein
MYLINWSSYCSDPELIYLIDGASKGVMQMLNTIIRNEKDGAGLLLKRHTCPRCHIIYTLKEWRLISLMDISFLPDFSPGSTIPTLFCCHFPLWWFSGSILLHLKQYNWSRCYIKGIATPSFFHCCLIRGGMILPLFLCACCRPKFQGKGAIIKGMVN